MYDPKTPSYTAGDQVTIRQGSSSHIYECAGGEYKTEIERTALVAFCNIVSDDALTEEEKQLWDVAWKRVGACYVSICVIVLIYLLILLCLTVQYHFPIPIQTISTRLTHQRDFQRRNR